MKKLLSLFVGIAAICTSAYAFNGSSFDRPVQACVSHILVPTEEQALNLKSEIKTYDDFQEFAKLYSQCPSSQNGGELGCFGYGQMVKPFEPVKTKFGYHLLWITRRY